MLVITLTISVATRLKGNSDEEKLLKAEEEEENRRKKKESIARLKAKQRAEVMISVNYGHTKSQFVNCPCFMKCCGTALTYNNIRVLSTID